MKPEDYHAIKLWGRQLGSFPYFIEQEQRKAAQMNAPVDALYERDGKWICVTHLKPGHDFIAAYDQYLELVNRRA